MKKYILIFCALIFSACVQKTYKRKVVFRLDVSNQKDIKTVGIRGEGNPLSWEKDFLMKEIVKDSLYEATIVAETGFKWFDIKFTVNGNFEFIDQPNREVTFTGDTTVYKAVFNQK